MIIIRFVFVKITFLLSSTHIILYKLMLAFVGDNIMSMCEIS
jgi:hypothetical protein